MTAPDLKPCPFCGGVAYLRDDVSHSTAYFIGCATEDCFGEFHWGQTEAEAIAAWNTRPTPLAEALAVVLEAMKDGEVWGRAVNAAMPIINADLNPIAWLPVTETRKALDAALRAIGEGKA